jgi:DNA polymerase elongation subunit (family B)
MQLSFIPLYYESFDHESKNWIRIFGRTKEGKTICVIDSFQPYLWAILQDNLSERETSNLIEKIKKIEIIMDKRTTKIEKVEEEKKNFLGKQVKALKIFITNYKDAHEVADNLDFPEIEKRREYDINIITKYITEKKIIPLNCYSVSGELLNDKKLNIDFVIKADKIEKTSELEFKPKVLAFDIETDEFEIGKGEILMISLVSDKLKKVLTWKGKTNDYVENYKNEEEMIRAFISYFKKENPDFLTGYFSDGFDLPYLRARAEKLGIKLSLGKDGSQPAFTRGNLVTGKISGTTHIDLFRFIDANYSQYLQSETLGLNEVAEELLGEGKKEFVHKHSKRIKENEWDDYFSYNLHDSVLTYRLFEKFWQDLIELTKIIQEPVFNVSRDRMSQHVEDFILHNLERFNEIAEKQPIYDEIALRKTREKYEGAYVFQPIPGLYEDLASFDFTSMHGSIINSFNLSLASYLGNSPKKDALEVKSDYNGNTTFFFSKKPSFFPILIGELIERRKQLKKQLKENPNPILKARSNAAKLLVNASYGYLGFFNARYYSPESASCTLSLVRKFIHEMIEKTNNHGYKVIYADTDSLFFLMNKKTKQETLDFLKKLNSELPGIMELELEDFYKRGLWVTKRTGEFGAKKKYALIDDKDKIKIRGFETVRRDWCNLARNMQSKVIEFVLKEGNEKKALEYVKKTIQELKERKIDKEDIMIKTQLKKPLQEYKAITPHVIAAEKIKEKGEPIDVGMLIKFFIAETREKKKLIREKVKLPEEKGEYNIEYYLNNQILPAVENILDVFGIKADELKGKKQKNLFEF